MLAVEVATRLASAGFGTLGTDAFYGIMPDEPDALFCVTETTGFGATHVFGETLPAFEEPGFLVRVRGARDDYDTPRALIERIYQHLIGLGAVTLSGTRYMAVTAQQPPFPAGRDNNGQFVFSCNFVPMKELSTP